MERSAPREKCGSTSTTFLLARSNGPTAAAMAWAVRGSRISWVLGPAAQPRGTAPGTARASLDASLWEAGMRYSRVAVFNRSGCPGRRIVRCLADDGAQIGIGLSPSWRQDWCQVGRHAL